MKHRATDQPGFWRRLIRAGLYTILILLGGLLAIGIGLWLSLRPFG